MGDKKKQISRRSFLQGVGSGIGAATLLKPLESIGKQLPQQGEIEEANLQPLILTVNNKKIHLNVAANETLADVLRNRLQLTGTKISCNHGECGCCTVLLDNRAVYACQMLALDAADKSVTTIEGLMDGEELHPVQQAFVDQDGLQCGFCTPGQIMAAQAVLLSNPKASQEELKKGLSGNLCRCAAYPNILKSAMAAKTMGGQS